MTDQQQDAGDYIAASERITFETPFRKRLTDELLASGVPFLVINVAFKKWHDGRDPFGPFEHVCFAAFTHAQRKFQEWLMEGDSND